MGQGNTCGEPGVGLCEVVKWVVWTVATAIVIALALALCPFVIVWCLLFDAD